MLRRPGRPVPQCLAVLTAIGGEPVNAAAVADGQWALLRVMAAVLDVSGACVLTVHDLDECDLTLGLLAVLAFDDAQELTDLPPARDWNTHDAA